MLKNNLGFEPGLVWLRSTGSGSSSVFSAVLIAKDAAGAGDKGSEDTTTVDVQMLMDTCFTNEVSFGKK
jgi:hypothetical protein